MKTTLNKIRALAPCRDGWEKLLRHLSKTEADDEPLSIETILDSNGLDDALWCLRAVDGQDRELRLYAVWCARRVEHLMSDPRSVAALDVAERYARGRATDEEREVAGGMAVAAWASHAATEWAVAEWAAMDATLAAAPEAARLTAGQAASAGADERTAQAEELRRVCREIEAGRDPYPEEDGR
jgi:hypothetical protein